MSTIIINNPCHCSCEHKADLITPGEVAEYLHSDTVRTPALDLVDAALMRALEKPDGRLIINMPPQEGKSERVGEAFPVLALMRNPETRIAYATYSLGLAEHRITAIHRGIIRAPELGVDVTDDDHGLFLGTGHSGGVTGLGIGMGVGKGKFDLVIIDDPYQAYPSANNEHYNERLWGWWMNTIRPRLAPGATVVVVSSRWRDDDFAGRLMNREDGWERLNIPAQCTDPATDPLGRYLGDYMDSVRGRTRDAWRTRKNNAGDRAWAALYQGHPETEKVAVPA